MEISQPIDSLGKLSIEALFALIAILCLVALVLVLRFVFQRYLPSRDRMMKEEIAAGRKECHEVQEKAQAAFKDDLQRERHAHVNIVQAQIATLEGLKDAVQENSDSNREVVRSHAQLMAELSALSRNKIEEDSHRRRPKDDGKS